MSSEAIRNFSNELSSMLDFANEVADHHQCDKIRGSLCKISNMKTMGFNEALIELFISRTHTFWCDPEYVDKIIYDIVGTLDNDKDIVASTPKLLLSKLRESVKDIVPYCLAYVYHKRNPKLIDGKVKFTEVYYPDISISKAKKVIGVSSC